MTSQRNVINKKFELMLTRRTFANCLCLSPAISLKFTLEMCGAAEDCKKTKSLILGVQGLSKSLILIRLQSSSLVLVVIGSISMPICNCFHGKLANNDEIVTFRSTTLWCPRVQVSLNLEGWNSRPLKSTLIAKNFIWGLAWSICSDFNSLLKCVSQPKIAKKSIKPLF